MKSSHSSSGLKRAREFLNSYLQLVVRPSKVTDRIAKMKPNLLSALIIVLLSGVSLTLGAFLSGGTALEIYQYQISTFLIELLTTPFPSVASITAFDYRVALLKDVVFFVKIWLVMSLLLFIFIRLFQEKVGLTDTLVLSAWTVSPWALIGFLFSPISLVFRLVAPTLFQYAFLFPLVVLGLIVAPAVFIRTLTISHKVPIYKSTVSYLLSIFTLFVLWTLNHPDILFYIVG